MVWTGKTIGQGQLKSYPTGRDGEIEIMGPSGLAMPVDLFFSPSLSRPNIGSNHVTVHMRQTNICREPWS